MITRESKGIVRHPLGYFVMKGELIIKKIKELKSAHRIMGWDIGLAKIRQIDQKKDQNQRQKI